MFLKLRNQNASEPTRNMNCSQAEREFYKNFSMMTKKALKELEADEAENHAHWNACSLKTTMHFSFVYAQEVN